MSKKTVDRVMRGLTATESQQKNQLGRIVDSIDLKDFHDMERATATWKKSAEAVLRARSEVKEDASASKEGKDELDCESLEKARRNKKVDELNW